MKAPIFGNLTIKSASARLTRTLSTLMASGIPMVAAIEIVAKLMSNRLVQVAVEDAKNEVEHCHSHWKIVECFHRFCAI